MPAVVEERVGAVLGDLDDAAVVGEGVGVAGDGTVQTTLTIELLNRPVSYLSCQNHYRASNYST